VALVDGEGNIAFIGHPASTNLEADIETLLKGGKLGGGADAQGGNAGQDDKFKDLDLAKVSTDIHSFKRSIEKLTNNADLKKNAANLARDLVVLVKIVKYDSGKGKFLTNFENVNVLIGPQADIDKVKPVIDEFITSLNGSFEKLDRIRAM